MGGSASSATSVSYGEPAVKCGQWWRLALPARAKKTIDAQRTRKRKRQQEQQRKGATKAETKATTKPSTKAATR